MSASGLESEAGKRFSHPASPFRKGSRFRLCRRNLYETRRIPERTLFLDLNVHSVGLSRKLEGNRPAGEPPFCPGTTCFLRMYFSSPTPDFRAF
jgi:hypothetical protein